MLNLANLVVAVAVCCSLLGIKGAEGSRVQDSWRRLRESGHTTIESTDPDFDTYTFTAATAGESSGLATEHVTGSYNSTGRHYSGFMATFHPSFFSFFPAAPDGCTALLHSTKMATADWHSSCEYATNGGFFNMDAPVDGTYCVGNLISEGKVVRIYIYTAYLYTCIYACMSPTLPYSHTNADLSHSHCHYSLLPPLKPNHRCNYLTTAAVTHRRSA